MEVRDAAAVMPRRLAYVYACVLAAIMGLFLLGIPVQLSDSFTEFTAVQGRSLWDVVSGEFYNGTYFRPLRRGLIKIVFDLSQGHFYAAFRGFQVLEVAILLLLAVRMLRVRTLAGLLALPLGLAVLLGIHTFAGAVVEAFPINHFLTILICCAAAVNLAQARPRAAIDAAAVLLLVAAMLTIESGLLVWVLFVACYIVGYRGVSKRGLIIATACVAAYFIGRFVIIGGAAPGLNERAAGFGFRVLSPDELVERFQSNPLPFYLYNVVSAVSCVLFAEPRGGVWSFVRGVTTGVPEAWQVVNVVTSTVTTVVLARYAIRRLPSWRRGALIESDRFVAIFLMLLPANALFAAGYEKDVILSPAGLFYAAAAYSVFRDMLGDDGSAAVQRTLQVAPAIVLLVAAGWTIRYVGIHDSLRVRAASVRNEWAYYDDWAREQKTDTTLSPSQLAIKQRLLGDAIVRAPRVPQVSLGSLDRLFDLTE